MGKGRGGDQPLIGTSMELPRTCRSPAARFCRAPFIKPRLALRLSVRRAPQLRMEMRGSGWRHLGAAVRAKRQDAGADMTGEPQACVEKTRPSGRLRRSQHQETAQGRAPQTCLQDPMPPSELGATRLPAPPDESPPAWEIPTCSSSWLRETWDVPEVPERVWPRLGTKAPLPPADGRRYYSLHRFPHGKTPEPLERTHGRSAAVHPSLPEQVPGISFPGGLPIFRSVICFCQISRQGRLRRMRLRPLAGGACWYAPGLANGIRAYSRLLGNSWGCDLRTRRGTRPHRAFFPPSRERKAGPWGGAGSTRRWHCPVATALVGFPRTIDSHFARVTRSSQQWQVRRRAQRQQQRQACVRLKPYLGHLHFPCDSAVRSLAEPRCCFLPPWRMGPARDGPEAK